MEVREAGTRYINTKSKSNKKQNYKRVGFFLVGYFTRHSIIKNEMPKVRMLRLSITNILYMLIYQNC